MPRFTIVLNTYNRAELLPRALGSVLAQSFTDFELLVVDDGSTDRTAAVVAAFDDPRVRYLWQVNAGLSAARNTGASCASGEYIAFLDDDDEVRPRWMERLAHATSHPRCGIAMCGVEFVDDAGRHLEFHHPRPLGPAFDDQSGLFLPGTFAVRRDIFDRAGRYLVGQPCSHQTELALRLVPACLATGQELHSIDEPLLVMYRRAADDRLRNRPERLLLGTESIIQRHRERLRRDPHLLANYLRIAGVCAARLGDRRRARSLLLEALRYDPVSLKNLTRLSVAALPPLAKVIWRRPTAHS